MKKYIILLLSIIWLLPSFTKMAPAQGNALLPMPTKEQLKDINEFLETLSPDEIEELAKIGEEMIETAAAEGRPLFPDMPPPPPSKPTRPKPPSTQEPATKKTTKTEKSSALSAKEKSQLQKMLSSLVEAITSIRQKATSDEKLLEIIAPQNAQLNDLTFYLNVINYSKHLVHLTDKEFTPLQENLLALSEKLEDLDNELEVPELEINKKLKPKEQKIRRAKLDTAETLIKKFMSIIDTSIKEKHIIKDLERLLKKYEPEALKIKQDQEAKTKKASDQLSNLPTTNTYSPVRGETGRGTQKYTAPPKNYRGQRSGYNYRGGTGSPARPTGSAAGPASPSSTKPGDASKSAPTQPPKKDDEKKKETANTASAQEQSQKAAGELRKKFKKTNLVVQNHKGAFHNFVDTYLKNTTGTVDPGVSKEINKLFNEVNFELKHIQKGITNWLNKVDKHATTAEEYLKHRDGMKDFIKNNLQDIQGLHKKTKAAVLTGASPRVEEHKAIVSQFNTRIDAINKELDKPL